MADRLTEDDLFAIETHWPLHDVVWSKAAMDIRRLLAEVHALTAEHVAVARANGTGEDMVDNPQPSAEALKAAKWFGCPNSYERFAVMLDAFAAEAVRDMTAERDTLQRRLDASPIGELVEAIQAVQDIFTAHGVPEWKTDQYMPDGYWSPSARMINTGPMMRLFAALAHVKGT